MNAAKAALAANQQGKFWEYHAELFKNYNKLNDAKFEQFAHLLGLDIEQFKQDMQNPALAAMIQRDLKDGVEAGVRGTPSIFINGRVLKQRSLPAFKQVINSELAKKKK